MVNLSLTKNQFKLLMFYLKRGVDWDDALEGSADSDEEAKEIQNRMKKGEELIEVIESQTS